MADPVLTNDRLIDQLKALSEKYGMMYADLDVIDHAIEALHRADIVAAHEPTREPVIPFVHWSKDPLVPYPGCACASCSSLDHQPEPKPLTYIAIVEPHHDRMKIGGRMLMMENVARALGIDWPEVNRPAEPK